MDPRQRTGRLADWARRYLPPELLGLAATLLGSWAALALSGSLVAAAVAATWAESAAFYGLIVARELRATRLSPRAAAAAARRLLLEFGPAELLDSTVVRPAALYAGMALAPSLVVGALAGKLAADVLFYLPTIASYELLRRRRAPDEVSP